MISCCSSYSCWSFKGRKKLLGCHWTWLCSCRTKWKHHFSRLWRKV